MQKVQFDAGDVILREGEAGSTAYLILSGSVDVTIGAGDGARSVATLSDGEVFGEMSLLDPGPRSATVTALTATECVVTSYDEFMATIHDNPDQAIAFMKTLVVRLRKMNEMMASLDPGKRGLMNVFMDVLTSFGQLDEGLTEEERRRRLDVLSTVTGYY